MSDDRTIDTELVIGGRFRGPPRSGNGGYSAGLLAALTPWPAVSVRLSAPPPLDTAMTVARSETEAVASYAGTLVARATPAGSEPTPVPFVEPDAARAAQAAYPGLVDHPFPTCFTCGTGREAGDGLRIFPGPVGDPRHDSRVGATWTPHPSLAADWHEYDDATREAGHAVTWAALDCTGGWAADLGARLMVLGSMTARVHALPAIGAEHVVVGEPRGGEGRRRNSAVSLYDSSGLLLATAEQVWIAVDPADFE